jgi:hypothetical protein
MLKAGGTFDFRVKWVTCHHGMVRPTVTDGEHLGIAVRSSRKGIE